MINIIGIVKLRCKINSQLKIVNDLLKSVISHYLIVRLSRM